MKCFYPQKYNDNTTACGRCSACKHNRINSWVARLERHQRYTDSVHFVTLTYAENQAIKTKNGLLTLDKDRFIKLPSGKYKRIYTGHITQFIKRLRNLTNAKHKKWTKIAISRNLPRPRKPGKITFYCAGEYGSKGQRPHYHLIMFNTDVELIPSAWAYKDGRQWKPRGSIHSGNTDFGSIRYALKYISKSSRIPLFQGDDRTREYSNMSSGIGKGYLTEAIIKWHRADLLNRYYVPGNGGVKISMPRYYADKIYTKQEKALIGEYLVEKFERDFKIEMNRDHQFLHNYISTLKYQEKKLKQEKNYTL